MECVDNISISHLCNGRLTGVEPLPERYLDKIRFCPGCSQVYWKGSHYERMVGVIAGLQD